MADPLREFIDAVDAWLAYFERQSVGLLMDEDERALVRKLRVARAALRSTPAAPQTQSPGEDGPAQPGAAATPGVHAVLAPFLVSPDHILDGLTCWCRPYRDAEDPEVIIHQQEARA